MANLAVARKSMTIGEGGSALVFAALALLSLLVAANAHTPEYAFHAYLFAAASVAAATATATIWECILQRHRDGEGASTNKPPVPVTKSKYWPPSV